MRPSNTDLAALRVTIDDIDANIIALLGQRFKATSKVGLLKAKFDLSAVDPEREAAQRKRFADLARKHNINEGMVQSIFRTVIDEVVINHKTLTNNVTE